MKIPLYLYEKGEEEKNTKQTNYAKRNVNRIYYYIDLMQKSISKMNVCIERLIIMQKQKKTFSKFLLHKKIN